MTPQSHTLNAVIADLEREHARALKVAEATRAALAALKDVAAVTDAPLTLGLKVAAERAPVASIPPISPDARIRAAVEFALRHAKRPLRVREMYDIAKQAGWAYPRDFEAFRGTVAGMLKSDAMFKKVEIGLYALA